MRATFGEEKGGGTKKKALSRPPFSGKKEGFFFSFSGKAKSGKKAEGTLILSLSLFPCQAGFVSLLFARGRRGGEEIAGLDVCLLPFYV